MCGSSPLARGLRDGRGSCPRRAGIIPARAGFTGWAPRTGAGGSDHPRSRGVYSPTILLPCSQWGSSPLARGLLVAWPAINNVTRIIPARAGFTRRTVAPPISREDHPRSRGVYGSTRRPRTRGSGSSPLARGLPAADENVRDHAGIIPARAGLTVQNSTARLKTAGSSPLARGLRAGAYSQRARCGIIPARAGFTSTTTAPRASRRDHPRSRGVYVIHGGFPFYAAGSSPLARGLRHSWRFSFLCGGIIPARAGFTRGAGQRPTE